MSALMLVDRLDRLIILELSSNSRQSFREIAKKLGISVATVIKRVERLKHESVIKGFTLELDFEKIGFDLTALVHVRASSGKANEIEGELKKLKGYVAIYDVTGASDIIVIAKAQTRQALDRFVKQILKLPSVERTDTQVVLDVVKEGIGNLF